MKKTLIGEACIWLDKVDLRKRIVNWHKLLVSPTQAHWRNVSAQGIESALNSLKSRLWSNTIVLSYVYRGNHEKKNKRQKHTQRLANVLLWNIEKTTSNEKVHILKTRKKVLKPWISCGCQEKWWEKFCLLNAKIFE